MEIITWLLSTQGNIFVGVVLIVGVVYFFRHGLIFGTPEQDEYFTRVDEEISVSEHRFFR